MLALFHLIFAGHLCYSVYSYPDIFHPSARQLPVETTPLKHRIETWLYTSLILLGIVALVLTFTVDIKGVDLFSMRQWLVGGIVLLCVGEWINHPRQTSLSLKEAKKGLRKFQHHHRNPCTLGNLLDIFGFFSICIGCSAFFR